MQLNELITLAKSKATEAGLDPALVCAIVEQESAWNPWAIRYEPAFQKKYIDPMPIKQTDKVARSISWGLCQVMGQVAREAGFEGDYASLCDPEVGLTIGCKVFKKKLALAKGDIKKALLYWNGGSRPEYVDEVLARVEKYGV
jgi:soluble lytic murein transglycosylase-like protein